MGDIYSLEVLGVIAGQPCATVLHFEAAETTVPNPIEVAKELIARWQDEPVAESYINAYLGMTPENYFMKGLRARRISAGGGPNVAEPIANFPGLRDGNADVSGVSPVLLYHCQTPGDKWVTGKVFVPGVSVEDVAENVLATALVTKIKVFGDCWETPIGAGPHGPFTQVVWSPNDSAALEIISNSVSAKIGTQRRRYVPL